MEGWVIRCDRKSCPYFQHLSAARITGREAVQFDIRQGNWIADIAS
jgi:hypothetical protein